MARSERASHWWRQRRPSPWSAWAARLGRRRDADRVGHDDDDRADDDGEVVRGRHRSWSRRTAEISETALLERVAVASHEGYDRVVFQFRNGLPGYRVEYAEPPLREDGSGNVVDLDGNAFVVVRMEPASGFDLTVPEGKLVYTGPRRIAGDGTTVSARSSARVTSRPC